MSQVERFYNAVMALDAIDPKETVNEFGMDAIFTRKLLRGATKRTGGYVGAITMLSGNPPESHAWKLAADYVTENVLPLVAAAKGLNCAIKPAQYKRWCADLRATLGINNIIMASRQS